MPRHVLYSVSLGPGVAEGLAQEFADKIAGVLGDPRGWSKYGYAFHRVPAAPGRKDVLAYRLETSASASRLCGIDGFSCWREGPNDIVIHLGNWMGGSASKLPLDRYRTYVINHETGHAFGLEHQLCPIAECMRRGLRDCPASVMQQMTRGPAHISPCVEADWPLDPDWRVDDPGRVPWRGPGPALLLLGLAIVVVLVICIAFVLRSVSGACLPRESSVLKMNGTQD